MRRARGMESEAAKRRRRGVDAATECSFRRSSFRFASAMSSVVEKYNFPFDGDVIVSIRSLVYHTSGGPKVWGEEQETKTEIIDSTQTIVPFKENTGIESQLASDNEEENYEKYQSPNEERSMVSYGKSLLDTGHKSNVELTSIKRQLENIHIKEDIPLVYFSATPAKNKNQVKMDVLLENSIYFGPESLPVAGPKAKHIYQWSPLQKLGSKSLSAGHHDVVLRKQTESINEHPASISWQQSNSAVPGSDNMTIVPVNQSLGGGNEKVCSSILEMYESADEHCSWNNVTIADLYPGMVKSLSRLFQKASHKASSNTWVKWHRYGYWHSKKTNLNASRYRVRRSRQLNPKSSLTIREEDSKGSQLSMANNGQISPLYDINHQMQCSLNNTTKVSSIDCNPDSVEMNASGIVEDHSYMENVGQNGMGSTIFPRDLSGEETFLVRTPSYISSLSDFGRKGETFEEYSSICTVDTGATFNVAGDYKTEMTTRKLNSTSCLSLSLNRGINSFLQNNKSSSVKTSNRLPGNGEIKTFNKAVSLQRSHSFPSLPVNRSPTKTSQKCDDAFNKMCKELCCSKMQKPPKCSTTTKSPRKSLEVCKFGFKSFSSNFNQERKDMIESIYQKLCSEWLPKIPASFKENEGIQMSDTVNALVNSPVRALPAAARIKRAADFCTEGSQTSPLKKLKNISENSPYRRSQKLPYWKNSLQKTDMTFILHTPNANNWTSNMDSGLCISSDHTFLAVPSMKDSSVNGKIHMYVQNSDSLRKSQNYPSHTITSVPDLPSTL